MQVCSAHKIPEGRLRSNKVTRAGWIHVDSSHVEKDRTAADRVSAQCDDQVLCGIQEHHVLALSLFTFGATCSILSLDIAKWNQHNCR